MADIELVIKIPEESYDQIIEAGELDYLEVITAIENGILLPKGHGDLVDIGQAEYLKICHDIKCGEKDLLEGVRKILYSVPVVVKADGSSTCVNCTYFKEYWKK